MTRACAAALVLLLAACPGDASRALGPPDSYRLFAPEAAQGASAGGLLAVRSLSVSHPAAAPLARLLDDGFGAEMVRTVFLAKQFVREAEVEGHRFPSAGLAVAQEALCVLIGADRVPYGRGLSLAGWLGRQQRPDIVWVGLPAELDRDRALVQTVAGRLATYALHLVVTGGAFSNPPLPAALDEGYRMAMEVIAREWRVERGPRGVVPHDAGTEAQRALFAAVRDNRRAVEGDRPRPAEALLADPAVAATFIYRLAQSKDVARRAAPREFYAPFVAGRVPDGLSPAAVLGAFRNFQAKLLGGWGRAVLRGRAPRDIADLVEVYTAEFPEEGPEALRVFLATTFGATVKPGGVSARPADAERARAELEALRADVLAGRRSLRAAVAPGVP